MAIRTYTPGPPLDAFVESMWWHETANPAAGKERVMPDGRMQIIINLAADRISTFSGEDAEHRVAFSGSLLAGAYSGYVTIDASELTSVMGVSFKPGGAFPFLGVKAGELRDVDAPLEALWGRAARALREQLLEARTPLLKFRILEQFLIANADRPLERHPAIAFALNTFETSAHTRTIASVSDDVGLSARRFIEAFEEEVGLTPKLFCRVQRFQRVLARVHAGRGIVWADVANACGYFDQAHFIRDFKSFSGVNPTTYLKYRGEFHNHIASPV